MLSFWGYGKVADIRIPTSSTSNTHHASIVRELVQKERLCASIGQRATLLKAGTATSRPQVYWCSPPTASGTAPPDVSVGLARQRILTAREVRDMPWSAYRITVMNDRCYIFFTALRVLAFSLISCDVARLSKTLGPVVLP
jgi:hypothetical protein